MAGEIFIALEETSQAIKTTVEETKTEVESVGTAVNEIKEDVGDGAGTDLVTRVANLEAKIDALANSGNENLPFPIKLKASDDVILSLFSTEGTVSGAYSVLKTDSDGSAKIYPLYSGAIRIKLKARSSNASSTKIGFKIYVNGGYVVEKTIKNTSYQEFVYDVNVDAGNEVSIYGGKTGSDSGWFYFKDVEFCATTFQDKTIFTR